MILLPSIFCWLHMCMCLFLATGVEGGGGGGVESVGTKLNATVKRNFL